MTDERTMPCELTPRNPADVTRTAGPAVGLEPAHAPYRQAVRAVGSSGVIARV